MSRLAVSINVLFALLLLANANCSSPGEEAGERPAATTNAPTAAENTEVKLSLPPGSDARAYFDYGMEAYRNNRDEEAVAAFKEAARLDPGFAEAFYRLGLAQSAVGLDEESEKSFTSAVEAYERILKEKPKNAEAQYFLGLALGKLGEYEKAVKALKDSVKNSEEEDEDKYYELGLAHYKLAQYQESVRALNKALEINPDYFAATDALERAKAGLERREAFLKRQEQLRRQGERAKDDDDDDSGAKTGGNGNASPAPSPRTPTPQRARPTPAAP